MSFESPVTGLSGTIVNFQSLGADYFRTSDDGNCPLTSFAIASVEVVPDTTVGYSTFIQVDGSTGALSVRVT